MSVFAETYQRVRRCWKKLFLTDIVFKMIAFAILTPLLGLCQKITIALASDSVLSDADFVLLLTRPVGIACGILVAAVWLAIIGLEQASLLAILAANDRGRTLRTTDAVRFAISQAPRVLGITGTLIAVSLLVVVPFAVVGFVVYRSLLGDFDINFYLNEKPSEFLMAVGIGGILLAGMVAVLVWLYSAWILSLPITLFERKSAKGSLQASRESVEGNRWHVMRWVAVWLGLMFAANAAVGLAGGWIGQLLIPDTVGSLVTLATRVGILLLVLASLSVLINLLATVTFAALMMTGYDHLRGEHAVVPGDVVEESTADGGFTVTRGRLAGLLAVGVVVAAWIGASSLKAIPLNDTAPVMAHRGASAAAPENTMAAFQLAIDEGADWIEIDVQESGDGEVIVTHDSDFMKQSGNALKVWDATSDQLADIDIGSWFDPKFGDQRVATLAEVLELCRDKVGVNIELKYYGHDEQLEQRVIEIVEAKDMADQVMLMSLKKEGVAKARSLRPDWKCGLLLSVYAGNLQKLDADFLAINSRFASRTFVREAHAAGKEVYVWTVNDAATMSQMLNRGVDGLLTDRPELARKVLAQRAEMSLPERLLSEVSVWLLGSGSEDES